MNEPILKLLSEILKGIWDFQKHYKIQFRTVPVYDLKKQRITLVNCLLNDLEKHGWKLQNGIPQQF